MKQIKCPICESEIYAGVVIEGNVEITNCVFTDDKIFDIHYKKRFMCHRCGKVFEEVLHRRDVNELELAQIVDGYCFE